jgi:hypothetical protein
VRIALFVTCCGQMHMNSGYAPRNLVVLVVKESS